MPYVTRKHFEMAVRESRRSVSDADLLKYESFSQKMKQQRGNMGSGVANFSFGENQNVNAPADDLDGLYDDVPARNPVHPPSNRAAAPQPQAQPQPPAPESGRGDEDFEDLYD